MKNAHSGKVVVGETIQSIVSITPKKGITSPKQSQNIVYNGSATIPDNTIFEITGIRNGYVYLHEHEVQEAEWSVLKRLFLRVVESSNPLLMGQELEVTGVAARSLFQRMTEEEQTATYRFAKLKQRRGLLKQPVRHTVEV